MARQVLPVVWTKGDIEQLKKNLLADATATDLGVQACPALSDNQRAQWGVFLAQVQSYAKTETSFWTTGSDANTGEHMQDQLYSWQTTLQGAGCAVQAVNPQPAEAPGSSLVRWGVFAIVAVAGAFVAHEVFATVRAFEPREPESLPPREGA